MTKANEAILLPARVPGVYHFTGNGTTAAAAADYLRLPFYEGLPPPIRAQLKGGGVFFHLDRPGERYEQVCQVVSVARDLPLAELRAPLVIISASDKAKLSEGYCAVERFPHWLSPRAANERASAFGVPAEAIKLALGDEPVTKAQLLHAVHRAKSRKELRQRRGLSSALLEQRDTAARTRAAAADPLFFSGLPVVAAHASVWAAVGKALGKTPQVVFSRGGVLTAVLEDEVVLELLPGARRFTWLRRYPVPCLPRLSEALGALGDVSVPFDDGGDDDGGEFRAAPSDEAVLRVLLGSSHGEPSIVDEVGYVLQGLSPEPEQFVELHLELDMRPSVQELPVLAGAEGEEGAEEAKGEEQEQEQEQEHEQLLCTDEEYLVLRGPTTVVRTTELGADQICEAGVPFFDGHRVKRMSVVRREVLLRGSASDVELAEQELAVGDCNARGLHLVSAAAVLLAAEGEECKAGEDGCPPSPPASVGGGGGGGHNVERLAFHTEEMELPPDGFEAPPRTPRTRDPVYISLYNHKGGVSKTTTAHALAFALAALGHSVAMFDYDSQGDLTALLLKERAMRDGLGDEDYVDHYATEWGGSATNTVAGLLWREIDQVSAAEVGVIRPQPVLVAKGRQNGGMIWAMLGDPKMAEFAERMAQTYASNGSTHPENVFMASDVQRQVADLPQVQADYVIIDMSPANTSLNMELVLSSDLLLVPCNADFLSFRAIKALGPMLARWRELREQIVLALTRQRRARIPRQRELRLAGYVMAHFRQMSQRPTRNCCDWICRIEGAARHLRALLRGDENPPAIVPSSEWKLNDPRSPLLALTRNYAQVQDMAHRSGRPATALRHCDLTLYDPKRKKVVPYGNKGQMIQTVWQFARGAIEMALKVVDQGSGPLSPGSDPISSGSDSDSDSESDFGPGDSDSDSDEDEEEWADASSSAGAKKKRRAIVQ